MTTIAFCGLGQMGAPMAARLLPGPGAGAGAGGGNDHDLVVWNRTPGTPAADELVRRGARTTATPAEAATGADVVVTMLASPEAVDAVVFDETNGLATAMAEGATLIEMSTIGSAAVRQLRHRLPTTVDLLDAPVLGSVPQATEGQLKIFVGGDPAVFERHRALLERMGTPRHLGPQGTGAAMKLTANLCLGVLMSGLGEALALARALGLDQHDVLDILAESPIGVTVRSKRGHIESGEYTPANFKLSLAVKDLRLVNEAARQAHLPLTLTPAAWAWLETAQAAGLGDSDYSAVIEKILVSSGPED